MEVFLIIWEKQLSQMSKKGAAAFMLAYSQWEVCRRSIQDTEVTGMVKLNDVYGAAAQGCGGDRAWLWYRHGKGKNPRRPPLPIS